MVQVRGRSSVDQQAEQLRPAVVAAGIHQLLSLVDQGEVEIGDHDPFTRTDRTTQQGSIGRDDRGEATTRYWADRAASILHDLGLLIGIQPSRGAYDQAPGLEGMLPDVDLCLLGKQIPEDRAGIHRGVDLLDRKSTRLNSS